MGKQSGLENFCTDLSPGEYEAAPIRTLVKLRKCPAYLLPSQPFLGRCVPTFGLVKTVNTNETRTNIRSLKTSADEAIDEENLKKGIEYLMKAIDVQGKLIKLFSIQNLIETKYFRKRRKIIVRPRE